jgi:hypothetical protein
MKLPSKDFVSTQPKLIEKRKKPMTTSEYELRNRKVQGQSGDKIARDKIIRIQQDKKDQKNMLSRQKKMLKELNKM